MPSAWVEMDMPEKAFIIASIDIKIETEKKERKKAEREAKRR